jgi:hypothetical protein
VRLKRAGVPVEHRAARTKPKIALAEIDRVIAAGVRFGCVLADAGYGLSAPFRQGLTARGLAWAVGIATLTGTVSRASSWCGNLFREREIEKTILRILGSCTFSHSLDPNQTSISTRKRDTLRSRWVSNRTGERAGTMEQKSVLRSVTGAIRCAAAGKLASPALSEAATLPCASSAGSMGRNGGELRQRVTRVAKLYELRALRSGPREEALQW